MTGARIGMMCRVASSTPFKSHVGTRDSSAVIPMTTLHGWNRSRQTTKSPRAAGFSFRVLRAAERQCLISGGSLPPLAASLLITCLCSQMFMLALSLVSPV